VSKIGGAIRKAFGAETSPMTIVATSIDNMKAPELLAQDQLQFAMDNDPNCFSKPKAELYGITEAEQFVKVAEQADVYSLLEGSYSLDRFVGIALHTSGWASPLDENGEINGAPSEHPERKRVALIVVTTKQGMGSAIGFAESNDIVTDAGEAHGSLSMAMTDCWQRSLAVR